MRLLICGGTEMIGILLIATLITSFISGVLGMGGGMILMGILSLLLPVSSAMVLHGFTQLISNGYRAYLLRGSTQFSLIPRFLVGALLAFALLLSIDFIPSTSHVFIALGLIPFLGLTRSISININRFQTGVLGGFIVTLVQLLTGTSGPLLDFLFVKSRLNRFEIIATKAFTQCIGHLIKLIYYGQTLLSLEGSESQLNLMLFPGMLMASMGGTALGKKILSVMSEAQFQTWSRGVLLAIGGVFLIRGISA